MENMEEQNLENNHKKAGRRSNVKEGEVRAAIVQVATKIFADKGYDATSMSDIAKASGVTKPLVFYYFGSKEGLFLEIVSKVQGDSLSVLRVLLRQNETLEEKLVQIVDTTWNYTQTTGKDRMRFFSNLISFKLNKEFFAHRLRNMEEISNLLYAACEEAKNKGEINSEPQVVASAIYSALSYNYFLFQVQTTMADNDFGVDMSKFCHSKDELKDLLKMIVRGAK